MSNRGEPQFPCPECGWLSVSELEAQECCQVCKGCGVSVDEYHPEECA